MTDHNSAAAVLPHPPNDASLVEIVRGHFHFHAIADGQPDPALAHFAADGGQHTMFVLEFDPEHRAGKDLGNLPFHDQMLFFAHVFLCVGRSVSRHPAADRLETVNQSAGLRMNGVRRC